MDFNFYSVPFLPISNVALKDTKTFSCNYGSKNEQQMKNSRNAIHDCTLSDVESMIGTALDEA